MNRSTLTFATALVALATPALAGTQGVVQTGDAVPWDLKQPGSLTWEVRLAAGHDYAVAYRKFIAPMKAKRGPLSRPNDCHLTRFNNTCAVTFFIIKIRPISI